MRRLALVLALGGGGAAYAAPEVMTVTYQCERGVSVQAAYVNGSDGSVAVIQVEGRQIALVAEPSGSGVRYAWPSDGSGYVWWTKGDAAMLLWRAPGAEETALYSECRPRD